MLLFIPGYIENNKGVALGQEDIEMTCPIEIHIGEVVDETEEYIANLLLKYQDLYENAINAQNSASVAIISARDLIDYINILPDSEVNDAENLSQATNITNCKDCREGCVPDICECTKVWESGISEAEEATRPGCGSPVCSAWGPWPPCPCPPFCFAFCPPRPCIAYTYTCPKCAFPCDCEPITGNPCPTVDINTHLNALKEKYDHAFNEYGDINDAYANIQSAYNPAISSALTEITTLTTSAIPGQISTKLDNSRKELSECFTPLECMEQLFAGEKKCIVEGSSFVMQFLYTCDTITTILEIDKPRCDYEAANFDKANNYFCCKVTY
ncbi:MAG: hypothetical protein ABH919_04295 [bacterium]